MKRGLLQCDVERWANLIHPSRRVAQFEVQLYIFKENHFSSETYL